MKKLPVCKLCKQRKVQQQEWKTEEEKEFCFTCNVFLQACGTFAQVLENEALSKGISRAVHLVLKEEKDSERLQQVLQTIHGQKIKKVFIKDIML